MDGHPVVYPPKQDDRNEMAHLDKHPKQAETYTHTPFAKLRIVGRDLPSIGLAHEICPGLVWLAQKGTDSEHLPA